MQTLLFTLLAISSGLAQNITAGNAIPVSAASPGWLAGSQFCTGYTPATPITASVDTSKLSGAIPPQTVLQNEMYGAMTCTFSGLTPGGLYLVTHIGAELYWTEVGQRIFSVAANGSVIFANVDLFAAGGAQRIATQRSATVAASATGTIVLTFTATVDLAKFDALIITAVAPPIPAVATIATDINGTTTITIPAAAQNTMKVCSVALAGSTYVLFAPQVP